MTVIECGAAVRDHPPRMQQRTAYARPFWSNDATDWAELADALTPPAWMRDALCVEHPSVSWFPSQGASQKEAKAICARCPVSPLCLDYAIREEITDGIWGGLSRNERARLVRGE